ncbi:MAG: DUF6268 family outer membrane beta-barrel protein [Chthoniobacterales bacterium]
MKKAACLLCLLLLLRVSLASAGTISSANSEPPAPTETGPRIPFELNAEFTYSGSSTVARGARTIRDFDETYSAISLIYTPRVRFGILRLGAAFEYFGFGFPDRVQLDDTLQSASAVVGLDTQFSDSILVRFEAEPGFYGTADLFDGNNFNVPFIIGGTYIYSSDLQFVLGASVNFQRKVPVYPGGGIRWRLASQWVLNAVLPTPRLEYELNSNVKFYVGANLKGSTFRVGKFFGTRVAGDYRLDNAWLDYTEIRAGLGAEIKLAPEIKLSFEGGYIPYREFDYHRTDVRYHYEEGAPYGSVSLRAAF